MNPILNNQNKLKYKIVEKGSEEPVTYNNVLMVFRNKVTMRNFVIKLKKLEPEKEFEFVSLTDSEVEKFSLLNK